MHINDSSASGAYRQPAKAGWCVTAVVVLLACVAVGFMPALSAGFAPYDDDVNFLHNPAYRGLGVPQLYWMWRTRLLGHYVPLAWMSLGLDYSLWGMDPFGYHLTSLLLHTLNALLLMSLARRLLRIAWPEIRDGGATVVGAFAAGLVFAVHPLRAESVAWITERRDVLCGSFVLLVVLLYIAAAEARGSRRRWLLAGSWLLYGAALLAKGIAVALPISLWALDAVLLERVRTDRTKRAMVVRALPYLLLAAAGATVTLWAIAPVRALNNSIRPGPRLAAAGFGLVYYLQATLLPWRMQLFIPWPADTALMRPAFAVRAGLLITLAALFWALRRRFPIGLAALVAYVAWVLPVSGVFQAGPQLAANRYSYLSCLPWALLAGSGVTRWLAGPRARAVPHEFQTRRVVAGLSLAAGAVFLVVATRREVALWHDPITFSSAEIASAPTSWLPHYHLAASRLQVGQWRQALGQVRAGLLAVPSAYHLAELGALILATSPDPATRDGLEARGLAQRAVDAVDPPEAFSLYALAAAQAEARDFSAAAATARDGLEALELADDMDDDLADVLPSTAPLAGKLSEALRQFEQRRPLRLAAADWL